MRCQAPADAGLLQVVLEREVELEVERVAIAADAPGVGGIDGLLDVRQEDRRVRVEDLAVGEHVALRCRRAAGAGSADRRRGRGSRARSPARAWRRRCAGRRRRSPGPATARCASGSRSRSRPTGSPAMRILQIERVHRDVLLVRDSDRTRRSCCGRCRDRSAGSADRARSRAARTPASCPRGMLRESPAVDRIADEAMVLLVRDVDQAGQPLVLDAAGEGRVEVAVDVVRQRDGEAGIAAGGRRSPACPGSRSRCG